MRKFKKADRERFMSDWRKCLPAMRVEKSMSLAKRNGPVLTGLYLKENRGNEHYTVVPYVHNLSRPTNFVSLTISYPLKNKRKTYQDDFTLKSHEREFPDACSRLHNQSLFPLGETLSLSQILRAYDIYVDRKIGFITNPIYVDPVCYLTWCGKIDAAKRLAEKNIRILSDWENRAFLHDGGKQQFLDSLAAIPENISLLRDTCEEQINFLKLDKLPDYGFLCD